MASLSLYPQFETNLMSNRNVIELFLQLKSAKAHGKNYIKVRPPLVRHLLRNRLLSTMLMNFMNMKQKGYAKIKSWMAGGGRQVIRIFYKPRI